MALPLSQFHPSHESRNRRNMFPIHPSPRCLLRLIFLRQYKYRSLRQISTFAYTSRHPFLAPLTNLGA